MRWPLVGVLLLAAGCDRVLAFGDADGPLRDGAVSDLLVRDGRDGPTADAPANLALSFATPASTDIPIGKSQLLGFQYTNTGGSAAKLSLKALPCLIRNQGSSNPPVRSLAFELPPGAGKHDLVLFAPPDALPSSKCQPILSPAVAATPPTFTVKPPTYGVATVGDQVISLIDGLKVKTLGPLDSPSRRLRALTWAGGSFGGAFFAALGDASDQTVTPSGVQIYRFTSQQAGPIPAWIDLVGKAVQPSQVEDLIWSPIGPCQDALYLGASAGGPPGAGVFCIDPAKKITSTVTAQTRSLDVAPLPGFEPGSPAGALLTSRWGGYFLHPPSSEITLTSNPPIASNSADRVRFARAGPSGGVLYAVGSFTPQELFRVSPTPHQVVLLEPLPAAEKLYGTPVLSSGGTFGQMVLVPKDDPDPALYEVVNLVAFLEETPVRQLSLVKALRCAYEVALNDLGTQLVVITGGTSSAPCSGARSAYLFEFELP